MNCIKISGPNILHGEVDVQGSKNAALPILAAAVLIPDISVVHNCPKIADIYHMISILEQIGCKVRWEGTSLVIDAKEIGDSRLPKEYVKAMRCSVVFMGAMLARRGEITLYYPGGCIIGKRPIDLHKKALGLLGAVFEEAADCIHAKTDGLTGSTIRMDFPSVGATQNAILAAVTAQGRTLIEGGAREPEVTELVRFLNCAGAKIVLGKKGQYEIEGVRQLHAVEFTVVSDRIVAGTYLLAGVASRGHILLHRAPVWHLGSVVEVLKKLGAKVTASGDCIELDAGGGICPIPYLETAVYPGFPTDLQSPLLAALSLAEGVSCVRERIFENRFAVAEQLRRMGADIQISKDTAVVCGVKYLVGNEVAAGELRGGAALVIAGLCARCETMITGCRYIDRGYEDICRDLQCLGGNMELMT
ncbi:MAG: UDP-N-acetylglucosamine 1-carboxyvinyltransferase [Lachnospiraceae bacterium]|nr:UDP-N-acetylglucosamine 1-carboxyvinyltransferase [Lachnospiraceae bacterium]